MSTQRIYLKVEEFEPRDDLILVKTEELKKEESTESGIVIAINQNESVVDRSSMGKVLAIGTNVVDIKLGKIVIWPQTDGIDLEFDDTSAVLLKQESIIGTKKE